MITIDNFDFLACMEDYWEFPAHRAVILDTVLDLLSDTIDKEIQFQKILLAPHERRAEAAFAVIETFNEIYGSTDRVCNFKETFLHNFRKAIRQLKPRKDCVSIEGLSIQDPSLDPEQLYIVKELMELIKRFLISHYDALTVDQFMRRFADGEAVSNIANDYNVSPSALKTKLDKILGKVSKYMKRISNE